MNSLALGFCWRYALTPRTVAHHSSSSSVKMSGAHPSVSVGEFLLTPPGALAPFPDDRFEGFSWADPAFGTKKLSLNAFWRKLLPLAAEGDVIMGSGLFRGSGWLVLALLRGLGFLLTPLPFPFLLLSRFFPSPLAVLLPLRSPPPPSSLRSLSPRTSKPFVFDRAASFFSCAGALPRPAIFASNDVAFEPKGGSSKLPPSSIPNQLPMPMPSINSSPAVSFSPPRPRENTGLATPLRPTLGLRAPKLRGVWFSRKGDKGLWGSLSLLPLRAMGDRLMLLGPPPDFMSETRGGRSPKGEPRPASLPGLGLISMALWVWRVTADLEVMSFLVQGEVFSAARSLARRQSPEVAQSSRS
mmetsp:Transcript_9940/g.19628  ORF Transcript_9940/g.19628 Transcript_9940/m.19628 type:complete len:356 (-) Transcript_9940:25-1092(-)